METIRNYLETMFAGLPNTPEVLRARDELWQMMEDKYSELIAEGKSENAAIGTVISEFGNLDEIAGELGLDRVKGEKLSLTKELAPERRHISMDEAKDYLREKGGSSLLTAFGVFLCIISVTGPILFSSIFPGTRVYRLMETIGICVMMVCIAAAVGCFIYASQRMKKWSFLKDEPCSIDYATSNFVQDERNRFRPTGTMMLVIGITLCVISWVPMLLIESIFAIFSPVDVSNMAVITLFIMVGLGVLLIVYSSLLKGRYETLLGLNDKGTVSGSYTKQRADREAYYDDPKLAAFMSVYWQTVTCVYLIWSFLTFNWFSSWIIWPIAAIIHKVIESNLGSKR